MESYVEMSMLIDYYGVLLTEKQLDIMNLYYNENLSLAEISEINNTSRQAIHDIIKRCNKLLMEYESKLKLMEISTKHNETKRYVLQFIEEMRKEFNDELLEKKLNDMEQVIINTL